MREVLKIGGVAESARSAEEEASESAPVNSRAANYAVINRIRDLAKWLIVVLGAIGGVLLTGAQLSDLGDTEGTDFTLALCGIALGLVGAGVALWFTVRVLLPVRISLHRLARENPASAVTKFVREEPESLGRHGTVKAMKQAVDTAKEMEEEAEDESDAREGSAQLERRLDRARDKRNRIEDQAHAFVTNALTEIVRLRMITATTAMFTGGFAVAIGIGLFTWATNHGEDATKGEATPKRASAVVVQLTEDGRKDLTESLGQHCRPPFLRAIALGGPADALEMVAVPSDACRAARFVLTPDVGAVVNEQRLRAVRACDGSDPEIPCVVYPNTPAKAKHALRYP